jgi:methyl-accepting chemotaxis protein
MNAINNMKTSIKLLFSFGIIIIFLIILAVVSYSAMNNINNGMITLYFDRTMPIEFVLNAKVALYAMRGDVYKYILIKSERQLSGDTLAAQTIIIEEQIKKYRATRLTAEEVAYLANFDQQWPDYLKAVENI